MCESKTRGTESGEAMATVTKEKRNDLTLELKYEVVRTAERETKISIRKLADMFQCGKTQISTILKDKDRIIELYEKNASGQMCHTRKRVRESKFSDVNKALYQWYLLAVSKNMHPDGSHLMEKAKEIADKLGVSDSFKWLVGPLEEKA